MIEALILRLCDSPAEVKNTCWQQRQQVPAKSARRKVQGERTKEEPARNRHIPHVHGGGGVVEIGSGLPAPDLAGWKIQTLAQVFKALNLSGTE